MSYKVVVVDDNPLTTRAIVESVDWASLDCVVVGRAEDGLSGLDAIREHRPHLVITDIRMPGCDGLDMIQRARVFLPPRARIILITGYADFKYAQRAVRLGAFDLVLKPIDTRAFIGRIRAALEEIRSPEAPGPEPGGAAETMLTAGESGSLLVRNALAFIGQHCCEDISLKKIAAELSVSPVYLSSLLRKATGEKYTSLVTRLRLDAAKRLLRDPKLRINEVAALVGYSDYLYFYHVFRRGVGMSPRQYKNMPD